MVDLEFTIRLLISGVVRNNSGLKIIKSHSPFFYTVYVLHPITCHLKAESFC